MDGAIRGNAGTRPLGDLYHFLLTSSWPVLLCFVTIFFAAANLVFATVYYVNGGVEGARVLSFPDMFFFSVQTMATIGYGSLHPVSFLANALVSFEALFGLVGFAMMTGLVFAKFSLPSARVRFSSVAVISRRDGVPSLMFRMANLRANRIVEAQVHVSLTRIETTAEGETVRRWYDLALTRDRSSLFALTWTAIHQIVEGSPLAGVTRERFQRDAATVVASMTGLDETLSQTVHARHYYSADDVLWGKRLADIVRFEEDGATTVDYARFDDVVDAPM